MCSSDDEECECTPLFVYGTLRPGQPKYYLLRGKTCAEYKARLDGVCLVSLVSYPMMLSLENLPPYLNQSDIINPSVYGDLVYPHERHYDHLLDQLDRYEDYDPNFPEFSLYWRVIRSVTVLDPEPRTVEAWVYMGNPHFTNSEYPLVESGDWAQYCEARLSKRRGFKLALCE